MRLHIVHFIGPINPGSASAIRNLCLQAMQGGAEEIALHMSSEGGNLTAGFALFTFLKSLPIPLTTHNVGSIESVAVPIFLAGQQRFASPKTRFMIHPLHWGFGPILSADHGRISEWRDCLDFDADRYKQIFDEATVEAPVPEDITPYLGSNAKIFTPVQATAAGIILGERQSQSPLWSEATHWWNN